MFAVVLKSRFVLGVSVTNDPVALVTAQRFPVQAVWAGVNFNLVYVPGAPAFVNTLNRSTLTPSAVVLMRRMPPATSRIADVVSLLGSVTGLGDAGPVCGGREVRAGAGIDAGARGGAGERAGQGAAVGADDVHAAAADAAAAVGAMAAVPEPSPVAEDVLRCIVPVEVQRAPLAYRQ